MNKLTDVATYAFLVSGIFVLTRPGSKGPQFVSALSSGFAHIVQAASGQRITGK